MKQAHKLADMYRDQVIQLEEQLSAVREQGEVGKKLFQVFLADVSYSYPIVTRKINFKNCIKQVIMY